MTPDAGRFDSNNIADAVRVIDAVLAVPGSWCNLEFEPIEDEAAVPDSALFGFLAARGPANPLATVMARTDGKRPRPVELGIQHQAGTKAATQLREAEIPLPEGAKVKQDHPRRGLVVQWPDATETATLIAWLFPAMRVLSRHQATNTVLYATMLSD